MIINGQAKLAGVVGWPVAHSRSPRLHGYWLRELGINGAYVPLPVHPDHLASVIQSLPRMGFAGVNVTVPHKEAVMPLLHTIDPLARQIGAVNTLVFGADGSINGQNTDAFGFLENLRQGAPDFKLQEGRALILGAGGAARAVIVALQNAGMTNIQVVNRSPQRLKGLIDDIPGLQPIAWQDREYALKDASLLVNTTLLGQTGQPALQLDLKNLRPEAVVSDIVYSPLQTQLLMDASRRGCVTVDGLGMLLWQAVAGFSQWFGVKPEVTPALRQFVLANS
jgi:shikimate dehydrogenase